MSKGKARNQHNRLRIIGGQWRGRRLAFADAPGLRPTPDRVRETLFNWLQADMPGARCLDLFAGSGACGLEALSRGAASVLFVERARTVAAGIRGNLRLLGADNAEVVCEDALSWLRGQAERYCGAFDVVFLDPPFGDDLLLPVCEALAASGMLAADARIYLESAAPLQAETLPEWWQIIRSGRAGTVYFHLCCNKPQHSV